MLIDEAMLEFEFNGFSIGNNLALFWEANQMANMLLYSISMEKPSFLCPHFIVRAQER